MADRAGYDPGSIARTYIADLAFPAWRGREGRRAELLAGPDPENHLGYPMALPIGIPGAPPSLRDLAALAAVLAAEARACAAALSDPHNLPR